MLPSYIKYNRELFPKLYKVETEIKIRNKKDLFEDIGRDEEHFDDFDNANITNFDPSLVLSMFKYCGEKAKITNAWFEDGNKYWFSLNIDDERYVWSPEFCDLIEKQEQLEFEF